MKSKQKVRFGKTEEAYDGFTALLHEIIKSYGSARILDIGGGAQPQLCASDVAANGLDYTVMDISEAELAMAPNCYKKVVMDISGQLNVAMPQFDMVFSRFVVEHVTSARQLHENVFCLLRPGGVAVHFFPTLWSLPFVVNWMLPEWLTVKFLSEERQARGKFAAYYDWCIGPTAKAVRRLEQIGYEVVEYAGFFGHGYYDGVPLLRRWHGIAREWLLRHPAACLTSFAWVILRKPNEESRSCGIPGADATLCHPGK
jgi:SAM-dependent methyltransferase